MNIYILSRSRNFFEFDMNGTASATMKKSVFGWVVEITIPNGWAEETIYWWATETAKEAFQDIHHVLRKQRRRP